MPSPTPKVIAIITGERGQREIVRPLAAVGLRCLVLDWELLRTRNRLPHLRFIRAVSHLLRARPGAIVFTDMSSAFLAIILLVARLRHMPVYLRLRGDPFAETHDQLRFHWHQHEWPQLLRASISWLLDRPLFAAVDHFVPVSEWIVRRLDIASRSSVVRIPISIEAFPARQHQPVNPLRLLAVTNFNYPQKVAALARFLDTYGTFLAKQGFTLTIAGTGIAWNKFRERHSNQAELPGFVRDVAALYTQHDAFVHFSDLDAFPYVVLEAQAAGLPVLVNNACGMLEQVEDAVDGYILDLEDRAEVEARLLALRDSVSLRTEMGARAREHVKSRYSLPTIGQALQAILHPRS